MLPLPFIQWVGYTYKKNPLIGSQQHVVLTSGQRFPAALTQRHVTDINVANVATHGSDEWQCKPVSFLRVIFLIHPFFELDRCDMVDGLKKHWERVNRWINEKLSTSSVRCILPQIICEQTPWDPNRFSVCCQAEGKTIKGVAEHT